MYGYLKNTNMVTHADLGFKLQSVSLRGIFRFWANDQTNLTAILLLQLQMYPSHSNEEFPYSQEYMISQLGG
jgi:hypothetical protein